MRDGGLLCADTVIVSKVRGIAPMAMRRHQLDLYYNLLVDMIFT